MSPGGSGEDGGSVLSRPSRVSEKQIIDKFQLKLQFSQLTFSVLSSLPVVVEKQ